MKLLILAAALTLAGCGGSSGGGANSSGSNNYSVTAIDGYLQNAEVWLDLNENFQLDAGEPNSLSGTNGIANLDISGLTNPEQYPVVVRAISNQTIDEDQGLVTTGYVMSAPAGETAITPLSTLVHVILKRDVNNTDTASEIATKKQSAITQVSSQLGIATNDVMGDFIKADSKDIIFAAQNIVASKILPTEPSKLANIADANQAEADRFIQQSSVITRSIKNVVENVNRDFNTPIYNENDDFTIDSDNDGYPDKYDAFPGDSTEFVDTDGDLIGNKADLDDDGDGLSDILEIEKKTNPLISDTDGDGVNDLNDVFPIDASEALDTDSDGLGNNIDTDDDGDGLSDTEEALRGSNPLLADTDNDGINDLNDAFPTNNAESLDTDNDGIGNNLDTDDDGDGLSDINENAKGTNPLLSDTDGDGKNDLSDEFPIDNTETLDTDGDGIGNNLDTDDDGDGVSDLDETASGSNSLLADTDGDGVNDLEDAFPNDSKETLDADGDGIGDNADLSIAAPTAANLTLTLSAVKRFNFSWNNLSDASHYILLENKDGNSGFVKVFQSNDGSIHSFSHIVPLYNRINAQYILQSCNTLGCTDSDILSVSGNLLNSIGTITPNNTEPTNTPGFGYVSLALSSDATTLAVAAKTNEEGETGEVYVFTNTDGDWSQQAVLKASNSEPNDLFGSAISLTSDGNMLVVGAAGEDSNTTGINGDQTNNTSTDSGAVYIFTRDSNANWQQQTYLKTSNTDTKDRFGAAIAMSSDGAVLAISALNKKSDANGDDINQSDLEMYKKNGYERSGIVYIFTQESDNVWNQQTQLKGASIAVNERFFGLALAISDDGNTLAVGTPFDERVHYNYGATYVFTRINNNWGRQVYLRQASNKFFGFSVDLSGDGKTLAVGAPYESNAYPNEEYSVSQGAYGAGAVYIYAYQSTKSWEKEAYLKASDIEPMDLFGWHVDLSNDGNTVVIGALAEDSSYSGVLPNYTSTYDDERNSGSVYVLHRDVSTWKQQAIVKSPKPTEFKRFGRMFSLSADGNTLAVGERSSVHLY